MKKIVSFILVALMVLSVAVGAAAEESFTITAPESGILYINGTSVTGDNTVESDSTAFFKAEGAVLIATPYGFFLPEESFVFTSDYDFSEARAIYDTGLEMVNGAQVRVGVNNLEEGAEIDALADSGLRFIATANYTDTVIAEDNVEFGILVCAEGSTSKAYIPAEKFQNEDRTVFSAAITRLSTGNFNRKYEARAYAKVTLYDGTEFEFTTDSVTRSIYQVSVGIMKNNVAEGEESLDAIIDSQIKNVLTSYINQVGVRLSFNKGEVTPREGGSGSYSGDLFFDVSCEKINNKEANVTITPLNVEDGFANEVIIADWWKNYIRINNNNTKAKTYISNEKLENNVLSFTFKVVDYTFDQSGNVVVVTEINDETLKGLSGGVAVSYALDEGWVTLGLSNSSEDVVPGCVILPGMTEEGKVGAIELLASIGMPVNPEVFEGSFGVYLPSDGSEGYQNIVTELYSKSGTKITCQSLPDTTKTTYRFKATTSPCYRVGIAMDGETPVITTTNGKASTYPSVFGATSEYHNYLYLRFDTEADRITECVFYCVPKDLDFSGDGEYSDIFSLDDYRIIIE